MKRLHESSEAADVSPAQQPEKHVVLRQQSAKRKETGVVIEADDLLSALPIELHHEIIVWLFRCHPASVGCLDATNTTMHASIRSARIKFDSWAHHQRMAVDVLSIARLAWATGTKNETDATTGLAVAVMYAYVAGSLSEVDCRYYRGLLPRDIRIFGAHGPLMERLGLSRWDRASAKALVEWITSNHHALNQQEGPSLFPAVTDRIQRDGETCLAPAAMGKYYQHPVHVPRGRGILRVGGPLDREGHARHVPRDTDGLDLLFVRHQESMEALVDLPPSMTMWIWSSCFCKKDRTCRDCLCRRATADALDRPVTECHALAWIDERTADHMPADIASCIANCPQLGLVFTDLFCVSDMHAAFCLDSFLFFGVVRARFDVAAFMASASRLRSA